MEAVKLCGYRKFTSKKGQDWTLVHYLRPGSPEYGWVGCEPTQVFLSGFKDFDLSKTFTPLVGINGNGQPAIIDFEEVSK